MNLHKNISKLKGLPEVSLDKQAILLGKHQLLAEINHRQDSRAGYILTWTEAFRLMWLRMVRKVIPAERFVVAALLVIVVTSSSTFMAQAAVPGDILWPLKLTYEKAELAFATDAATEGRIHIRHADNRLKELSVVVAQPNTIQKSKNISQLVRRLEKDITAAGQSLKITQEEKKDSDPQVVVALATDLNNKATEAIKVLEENKSVFIATSDAAASDDVDLVPTSTSSDDVLDEKPMAKDTVATTTVETKSTKIEEKTFDVEKAISEVQIVNEYISYNAISSLIDLVDQGVTGSREQAAGLLRGKISEQEEQIASLKEAVPFINDNFLIHKGHIQAQIKLAEKSIKQANDALYLGYLKDSLAALTTTKQLVYEATTVLQNVAHSNGLISDTKEESVPDKVVPKVVPLVPVTMQSLGATSSEPVVTGESE